MILLSTMMIPWDVTMIPQYMEFNMFGWINTLKPLIVPAWFGSAYYIFLMRQFLMGIPKDFEEAARIDGANSFQIYWKIFMPILRPSLILVGVLNMITAWNDYLGPLIFLQDRSKYTLALGLAQFKGVHTMQIIPMLCITIIMIVPPIIIFILPRNISWREPAVPLNKARMRRTDMKQRVKKRWEDHTITGIGRREARAAFYEDTSEKSH